MNKYKYYLSITSQIPFCSIPLRLDTYNRCQFGCSFCFAKARGGKTSTGGLQQIDAQTLKKRLHRIAASGPEGAVDEFLERRVPIQLGGMTDPFSQWEVDRKATLQTLQVLADFGYPTVISTKGVILGHPEYIEVLKSGNFYVRLSVTLAADNLARLLETGVASVAERLKLTQILSNAGVPVSIRLQPIILGHEEAAEDFIDRASQAGAKHISAEYLKWPIERQSHQAQSLDQILPGMKDRYIELGARRMGREYVLPPQVKYPGLDYLRNLAENCGMIFGFADNEFLLLNKFKSCCNGADLFLNNCNVFDANISGIIKNRKQKEIRFSAPDSLWMPDSNVFSHLNSHSRPERFKGISNRAAWVTFLRNKWNGGAWRGGPDGYWGIEDTGARDANDNRIFSSSIPSGFGKFF